MTTFKEDRIARGWKKRFPKRKKGQMTKKEEREFFGHKFECKEQKLALLVKKSLLRVKRFMTSIVTRIDKFMKSYLLAT